MVSKVIAFLLAGVVAAHGGIDFTPQPHKTPFEGGVDNDVAFASSSGPIIYLPPSTWRVSGDVQRATFRPDAPGAEVTIDAHPLPKVTTFDEDTVKALKAELIGTLPRGSENVVWGDDQLNMLHMNRHETYRVVFSYSAYAQRFKATVLFCNFEEMQIRFQLVCREADYKRVFQEFKESLISFRGLK